MILFWEFRGGGGDGGGAVGFLISCVDVRERNDDGIFPIFFVVLLRSPEGFRVFVGSTRRGMVVVSHSRSTAYVIIGPVGLLQSFLQSYLSIVVSDCLHLNKFKNKT